MLTQTMTIEYAVLTLSAAYLVNTKLCKKPENYQTLVNGYSSEITQQELSNEYQRDRVKMMMIFI